MKVETLLQRPQDPDVPDGEGETAQPGRDGGVDSQGGALA